MLTPGTSCSPSHSSMRFIRSELPSAVSAMVTTIAANRPTMAVEIGQLGADEPRRLVAHQAPHLAQRLAQVGHPAQPRPRGGGKADDADRGARLDRRVHQVDQLLTEIAGHLRFDLRRDLGEQFGIARQHEAGGGEADHEQRKQREDREVGDTGRVEVALAVLVALLRPHDVVEPAVPRPQAVQDARFGRLGVIPTSRERYGAWLQETLTGHIPAAASSQTRLWPAPRRRPAPTRARQDRRAVRRPAP